MNSKEIWKPVAGYEGLYDVSNLGQIRSHERVLRGSYAGVRKRSSRVLRPVYNKLGYAYVTLCSSSRRRLLIHRLVAEAFLPNPENLPEVDHIDTNPSNNSVENLRWCSRLQNNNNPKTLEHHSEWERTPSMCKNMSEGHRRYFRPVAKFSPDGKTLISSYQCIADAAKDMNCQKINIINCCKGKSKSCKGFVWRYIDTESHE